MGYVSNMKAKLAAQHGNKSKINSRKKHTMRRLHANMRNARNSARLGNLKNTRTNQQRLAAIPRPSSPPPSPPTKKKSPPAHCKFAYAAKHDPKCNGNGGAKRRRRKTKRRRTKRRRRTRRRRRR